MIVTKEVLEKLYLKDRKNQSEISNILNISRTSVSNYLTKYNIPKRKRSNKYYANDNFFSKWSKEMAYCLGFIAADGHIWKDRPFITIGIHKKDKNVLEYIRDNVSPSSKIRDSINYNQVQLTIRSEKIWNDLDKYNVNHRKTFFMKIDFHIPSDFFGDYVRGFFDGDGSIFTRNKKKKPYYWVSFVSASNQMLTDLQKLLGYGKVKSTHGGKYYVLEINQRDALKIKELMYGNSKPIMLRKYDLFNNIECKYNYWTVAEDEIIKSNTHLNNKQLHALINSRTLESVKARRGLLKCCHKK